MKELLRLLGDDSGQDLVEYGLLVATFVAVVVALFPQILAGMVTAFGGWIPAANGVSESPFPN
jgi:Flp pilus assembly pilin Flp